MKGFVLHVTATCMDLAQNEKLLTNLSAITIDSANTPQWLVNKVMRNTYKTYCIYTQMSHNIRIIIIPTVCS